MPKNNILRTAFKVAAVLAFASLVYLSLLKINTEQTNLAIDNNMAGYFTALNKEDYAGMRRFLYPSDNEKYLLDILLKSKAVGITSVRLQKIYPALVDKELAIVGFETSTNAVYEGRNVTTRQVGTYFFRKKDNVWYIAKPEDLQDIPAQRISDMIDAYQPTMKANMSEDIAEQQEYNEAALKQVQGVKK